MLWHDTYMNLNVYNLQRLALHWISQPMPPQLTGNPFESSSLNYEDGEVKHLGGKLGFRPPVNAGSIPAKYPRAKKKMWVQ